MRAWLGRQRSWLVVEPLPTYPGKTYERGTKSGSGGHQLLPQNILLAS